MQRDEYPQLPALIFITPGPPDTTAHYRVDMTAPENRRDRQLLRALLHTASDLLKASEPERS